MIEDRRGRWDDFELSQLHALIASDAFLVLCSECGEICGKELGLHHLAT